MAKEIERKYLVSQLPDLAGITPKNIVQGYVSRNLDGVLVEVNAEAVAASIIYLRHGRERYGCAVPREDAMQMLSIFCTDVAEGADGTRGYFDHATKPVIRLRIQDAQGFLTIKSKPAPGGLSRDEFEYELPLDMARAIMDEFCLELRIEKSRYCLPHGDYTIELDVFHGALEGLVIAEVELPSEDAPLTPPNWFGEEVSADPAYSNFRLAQKQSGK